MTFKSLLDTLRIEEIFLLLFIFMGAWIDFIGKYITLIYPFQKKNPFDV